MTRTAELAESVSTAFLLLLESLGPVERAVFLLHEVFDYGYGEIAEIVGKSEANCRQMAHRAQQHLREQRPRFKVSREQQERVTLHFLQVCEGGDLGRLVSMLTDDVVLISDGGGKVQAARNPIYGPSNVARFIFGVLGKVPVGAEFSVQVTEVNGQPGIILYLDGAPNGIVTLDLLDEQKIRGVNIVVNPDKLDALSKALG
jgi:RNA polymerase sigma-70 factor (ECF subfamily)